MGFFAAALQEGTRHEEGKTFRGIKPFVMSQRVAATRACTALSSFPRNKVTAGRRTHIWCHLFALEMVGPKTPSLEKSTHTGLIFTHKLNQNVCQCGRETVLILITAMHIG